MRIDVSFHNLDPSPALEAEIRKHVAKLERIYDRITTCRVSVEALHKQHRTGNVYDVHVELVVPRGELVISREPHKVKERYASPDVRTSIRDAFRAAERQVKEHKEQLRGDVKLHESEAVFQGQVAQLYPQEGHGFILTNTGTQLYFARTALMNGDFDKLERGAAVHYVERDGDTGPIAYKVWVGPDHHMD
jgi:ribosome-associated translation inhibitor RaiA/cold shock CspA family protein